MTQSLNEFIRGKSLRPRSSETIDWDGRRDAYLAAVTVFYEQVRGWLEEPLAQGSATLTQKKRQLTEDHIGMYSVNDLVLTVGDEEVLFSPRGRNTVGASGRIDVSGERSVRMLLLMGARWVCIGSRSVGSRFEPLDEHQFTSMLRDVMSP